MIKFLSQISNIYYVIFVKLHTTRLSKIVFTISLSSSVNYLESANPNFPSFYFREIGQAHAPYDIGPSTGPLPASSIPI